MVECIPLRRTEMTLSEASPRLQVSKLLNFGSRFSGNTFRIGFSILYACNPFSRPHPNFFFSPCVKRGSEPPNLDCFCLFTIHADNTLGSLQPSLQTPALWDRNAFIIFIVISFNFILLFWLGSRRGKIEACIYCRSKRSTLGELHVSVNLIFPSFI